MSENGEHEAIELHVDAADAAQRLDRFVAERLPELSRSFIQRLIDDGRVLVNDAASQSSRKMKAGDIVVVEVPPPEITEILPEPIPLDILYEDADLLVLNKPAGMVVHPAPGHATGTLVNALVAHAPEIAVAGSTRPGLVHRLDKDTSGVMVVAKTDRGHQALVAQWEIHSVEKTYLAIVHGVVEPEEGTIEVPIGRNPVHRQRMAALPTGRVAVSHFTVRERFAAATLLEVQIETGRTHQIRVHLAFIGHPVLGDEVYAGRRKLRQTVAREPDRQMLHAARLGFHLPDGSWRVFEAPLPDDFMAMLEQLRAG